MRYDPCLPPLHHAPHTPPAPSTSSGCGSYTPLKEAQDSAEAEKTDTADKAAKAATDAANALETAQTACAGFDLAALAGPCTGIAGTGPTFETTAALQEAVKQYLSGNHTVRTQL